MFCFIQVIGSETSLWAHQAVRRLVGRLVGQSVGRSAFSVFSVVFCITAPAQMLELTFSITAPAHPHATLLAVYTALFFD